MNACYPDSDGTVVRDGVAIRYERYGQGRPAEAAAYTDGQFALDALAVMDAAGIESAVLVSVSCGALWSLRLCAEHPDRVLGPVFIAPTAPLVPPLAERRVQFVDRVRR